MSNPLELDRPRYGAALKAGVFYFGAVFSVGFVLGTARMVFLSPWLGEIASVVLEVPVILSVSWIASRASIMKFRVPEGPLRLLMGAVAFVLLMLAEAALSILIFGTTVEGYFASYWSPQGAIGLLAQTVFAIIPLAQRTQK